MSSAPAEDLSLLIVEDDRPFLTRLARAMEGRGYEVSTAETVEDAVAIAREAPPAFRRHRHAAFRRQRARRRGGDPGEARGFAYHHPHRLRQHRPRPSQR